MAKKSTIEFAFEDWVGDPGKIFKPKIFCYLLPGAERRRTLCISRNDFERMMETSTASNFTFLYSQNISRR